MAEDTFVKPNKTEAEEETFTAEMLVEAAYSGFSSRNRERISRDDIMGVVAKLDLNEQRSPRKSPTLRIRRLRFDGEKRLQNREPIQFSYDQEFLPGVNVICIPDNEVGKSSILKTIKYGLTGDNSDYDADVRSWISDIWLVFTLDNQEFTTLISMRNGGPHALLVSGDESRPIEIAQEEPPLVLVDAHGAEEIKDEIQRFFFQRIGLRELSWTQEDSSVLSGIAERRTSWLTYFQALEIPDGSARYLLCDPQHAWGNQEGLIFSAFLGLNLVESLNRLGVEAALLRKEARSEERRTVAQIEQAQERARQLESESQRIQEQLENLNSIQTARRQTVEGGETAQRLIATHSSLIEKMSEKVHLEIEREELTQSIQRRRARERQLREAAALLLHFTGLEVLLCPNCDVPVDSEALEQENTAHICRLCGKQAPEADPRETAALNSEADHISRELENTIRGRDAISARLSGLRSEIDSDMTDVEMLTESAKQGIGFALPTLQEETEMNGLYQQLGQLQAELIMARQQAELPASGDNAVQLQVRIIEKVRDVLSQVSDQRNHELLEHLSTLTQDMTRRMGAESINDVTCTPLGRVQLRKHNTLVSFTGIRNEGEKLRIKLAFFLAMMRLGREPSLGRHPGMLLIDQPGSNEMVQEDADALADIFHRVDDDLSEDVQIICCTSRQEFEAATDASKVFGPQAGPYAF